MGTKSIRGGLILMMLLLLAVNAVKGQNECPCKDEDTSDMEADCQNTLTCLDDNKEQCQQPVHMLAKAFVQMSECKLVYICVINAFGEYFQSVFQRGMNGEKMDDEDKLKQELMAYVEEKYPCLIELDKNNEKCSDEASAKKCFAKVTKKPECVDAFLQHCKDGESISSMAESSSTNKKSEKDSGSVGKNTTATSGAMQLTSFVGIIIALLML